MKTIHLRSVDSTNEYCKRTDCGELMVFADEQTDGRGTKGRSFVSDTGGVYVSVMRRPENFPASDAFKIMIDSCVAVCRTLQALGVSPVIRWANDVLVGGKKICGTLIENTFSGGRITRSIVGIGLNVNNRLPDELGNTATTLCKATGEEHNIEKIRAILAENLQREFSADDYRSYINWFGERVTLSAADGVSSAVALGVEDDGRLIVRENGRIKKISSAEVSLRL